MEISGQPERPSLEQTILMSRGFLIFMIAASGWSLDSMLRHQSARFLVPHYLVTSFAPFGRADGVIDLGLYIFVIWVGAIFVRVARDRVERAWVACWIGPILLNPLKMLIPNYAYLVWWAELFLTLVFLLATIALLSKWKPTQTLARCRARFDTTMEPPPPKSELPDMTSRPGL